LCKFIVTFDDFEASRFFGVKITIDIHYICAAMKEVIVENLEFLCFESSVGYVRRHILNFQLKKALKMALREDLPIVAVGEDVARGLHRFYYVPVEKITIV